MDAKEFKRKAAVIIIIVIVAFGVGYIYIKSRSDYKFTQKVAGIRVNSNIPIERLASWNDIGLLKSDDRAVLACNFELSAVAGQPYSRQYLVYVEEGEQGIYIDDSTTAYIRGSDSLEILDACHAFACMIGDIACSDELLDIDEIVYKSEIINIILDGNISGPGTRAYVELLGPIAFYQAQQADTNEDRVIQEDEVKNNKVFIFTYIREGNDCVLQPMTNALQKIETANVSFDCQAIKPAIYIEESPVNEIRVVNSDTIYMWGSATELQIEAIIIGDIIAPAWNLVFHGVI